MQLTDRSYAAPLDNTYADLTVVILTFNEEIHIERCLRSAFQVTRKVFVVDSFSTDKTTQIAEQYGAQVWQHKFTTHAAQLYWALDSLPIQTEWVMRVDADELITQSLADDIRKELANAGLDTSGFLVPLFVRFKEKFIRHGGYPQWQLRIWRNGKAAIEQRWMDEHMIVKEGSVERLKGEYIDDNLNNITWWTTKHNGYATREAIDLLNRIYGFLPAVVDVGVLTTQARYKRWLKENVYVHLPLGFRAFLFFCYRMIFRLGFLDGSRGFAFHFLQGCWYRYLVDVKVVEVERRMRAEKISCLDAIKREFGIDPTL
jgi:glycosyltransferase involved in cell wall biosynthesis